MPGETPPEANPAPDAPPAPEPPPPPPTPAEALAQKRAVLERKLKELVAAAQMHRPAEGAVRALSLWLDEHPEVLNGLIGTQDRIREYVLQGIGTPDALLRETIRRDSKQLEADLAGPGARPMVRILANQAGIALMLLRKAEVAVATGKMDAESVFASKMAESAQRQLLNTLRSIVTIQIALAAARPEAAPAALE